MFTRLMSEARAVLAPGGWLLTEVGAGQAPWVAELASVLGFGWTDVRRDLAGIERVVAARR
jgi:release factor glutamine methyltransferase